MGLKLPAQTTKECSAQPRSLACNPRPQRLKGTLHRGKLQLAIKNLLEMMALSVFHSKFRNCSDLKQLAAWSTVQITREHHPLLPWSVCNPASEFVRNWCHPVLIQVTLEWGYKFTRIFFFTVIWKDSYQLNMSCLQMSHSTTEEREEVR